MQKIINSPEQVVDEMLEGYLKAHADVVSRTDNPRVLRYRLAPVKGKVGIVTGGGSGHKPAFIGYLGRNMVDVVAVGKQLLMTRGALTTFSIANDVSKYFAIIPAMLAGIYPQLDKVNVMQLSTPESAILSAVIFNALIIIALVPLALRGVAYRARPAAEVLRTNLMIYGLGGIVAPFIGIKLIDLLLVLLRLN